jgi:hypothetical protein
MLVPAVIADAGAKAARRFLEFFAATIRNKNVRMAYYRAACYFFGWVERYRICDRMMKPSKNANFVPARRRQLRKIFQKGHTRLEPISITGDYQKTRQTLR